MSPRVTFFVATRFLRHTTEIEGQNRARRDKDNPAFRATEIYHREATAHVHGKDLPELGELLVTYQGCRENTISYSPITKSIDLATFFVSDEVRVSYRGCGENKICLSPITKPE